MSALDRDQLRQALDREGISPDAYSLSGGLWEDRYCLDQLTGGRWSVYFAERGIRRDQHTFDSEASACAEVLKRILEDPTTRRR